MVFLETIYIKDKCICMQIPACISIFLLVCALINLQFYHSFLACRDKLLCKKLIFLLSRYIWTYYVCLNPGNVESEILKSSTSTEYWIFEYEY